MSGDGPAGGPLTPQAAVEAFGENCRRLRKEKGWNLEVLADKCGLSASGLSNIENGKCGPSLYNAVVIAKALGSTPDAMTGLRQAAAPDGPLSAAADTAADEAARTWDLPLPARLPLLSLNGREHWSERNRRSQALKQAAWACTRNAKVPPLRRVRITAVYEPPDKRRRDPDNLSASLKPLIDGIVAAGVIPDDIAAHVVSASCEIGPAYLPFGRLRLVIREAA